MAQRTCSEDGCEKPVHCRERCQRHYRQLLATVGRKILDHQSDRGPYEGCWLWTGSTAGGPSCHYGTCSVGNRRVLVHRAVYEAIYGPIRGGLWVLHHCDTPLCFRPDHLFLGDASANSADMVAKGRGIRGERQHLAKLTGADAVAIRQRHASGATKLNLAGEFGVDPRTIEDVLSRRTWKHVA